MNEDTTQDHDQEESDDEQSFAYGTVDYHGTCCPAVQAGVIDDHRPANAREEAVQAFAMEYDALIGVGSGTVPEKIASRKWIRVIRELENGKREVRHHSAEEAAQAGREVAAELGWIDSASSEVAA